jgi:hypothetical protein
VKVEEKSIIVFKTKFEILIFLHGKMKRAAGSLAAGSSPTHLSDLLRVTQGAYLVADQFATQAAVNNRASLLGRAIFRSPPPAMRTTTGASAAAPAATTQHHAAGEETVASSTTGAFSQVRYLPFPFIYFKIYIWV